MKITNNQLSNSKQIINSKFKIQNSFKVIIWLLVIVWFLIIGHWNLKSVLAQQTTLSLSPPLVETIIKPGKSILIAYTLQNLADPNIFKVKVLPFIPKDALGKIRIIAEFEGPIRFSLDNSDIELNKPFFLRTKDSTQLLLSIKVPEDVPEGDYYYTLLAETQPPPISEGLTVGRAKATIGTNILITVTESGQVDVKGRIAFFDVLTRYKFRVFGRTFRIIDSTDKIAISLSVENMGNNVIKPDGEIILKGNFGERASYQILPDNILARSQRLLLASPSAELNPQKLQSLVITGFFLGNYKVSTNLNFGEGSLVVSASTKFLALPFKFLVGLGIIIMVTMLVIKKLKNKED